MTNGSGGAGTTHFKLPSFTSRIPKGTVGTPTVPTTITSSASSAVDVHTHTVNSTFAAGNANDHTHAIGGSTGNNDTSHSHSWSANFTTGNNNASHSHTYFKPNSGANNNSGNQNADHSHNFNSGTIGTNNQSANHAHSLPTNTGNANTTIGVNSSLTAGNASTINAQTLAHTHGVDSVDIVFIIRVA